MTSSELDLNARGEILMDGERLRQQKAFFVRVGALEMEELTPWNIFPDTINGVFFVKRAAELHEICRRHTNLHIISRCSPMILNRYEPIAGGYLLGDGDRSPELEWELKPPTLSEYRYALTDALKIPEEQRDDVVKCAIRFMEAAIAGADLFNAKSVRNLIYKRNI